MELAPGEAGRSRKVLSCTACGISRREAASLPGGDACGQLARGACRGPTGRRNGNLAQKLCGSSTIWCTSAPEGRVAVHHLVEDAAQRPHV